MTFDGAIETAQRAAMAMGAAMYVVAEGDGWQVYQRPTAAQRAKAGAIVRPGGAVLRCV